MIPIIDDFADIAVGMKSSDKLGRPITPTFGGRPGIDNAGRHFRFSHLRRVALPASIDFTELAWW